MSTWNPIRRRLPDGADCRFCLAAGAVAVLATAAVAYGVANDDAVTALGALLLVPAALLLAGIGLSGGVTDGGGSDGRTDRESSPSGSGRLNRAGRLTAREPTILSGATGPVPPTGRTRHETADA